MAKSRIYWVQEDARTRVEAWDVDNYPKHHFAIAPALRHDFGWPLQVVSVGDDEWGEGCLRNRYNSQIFAIELVTDGEFYFKQEGREHVVRPGGAFLVRPGVDTVLRLARGVYGRKRVIEIVGPLLPSLLSLTGLDKVDTVRPTHPDRLIRQYDRAYAALDRLPPDYMRACSDIAYGMLTEVARSAVRDGLPVVLRQLIGYMEEQIGSKLTLDDLCRVSRRSKPTLNRLFMDHLGEPPLSHFIGLKMQVAKTMLAGPNVAIKDVAARLGYSNQLYFSAQFKQRVGVSPKAFQQTVQAPGADAD